MQKNERFAVFWFDPEPTIGAELRKIRPCIVVSPEIMNNAVRTVLVTPLTSSIKSWPFRTTVTVNGQKSSAACDQIRSIDNGSAQSAPSQRRPHAAPEGPDDNSHG